MSHAAHIEDSLVRRLCAQLGYLGVDVHVHLANVREMCERNPGMVENPSGLLISWCHREAEAQRRKQSAAAKQHERYARLLVAIYCEVASGRFTPRELARVLSQAQREGYSQLNPHTIELLRAMGNRWDPPALELATNTEGPSAAGARDATGRDLQSTGPGRSHVASRAHSEAR